MIERECLNCGKKFLAKPYLIAEGNGKYCCRKCSSKSRRVRIKRICQYCGIEFEITPAEIKKGGGKHCSRQCCDKAMVGKRSGDKHPMYGKHHKNDSKKRTGDALRGNKNHNYGKIGELNHNYGRKRSDETCRKISNSLVGKYCGEKAPGWKGGISYDGYCKEWIPSKPRYRAFFNDTCVVCGKHKSENIDKNGKSYNLSVHHVFGNKDMCCDDDLDRRKMVSLCMICHGKVNTDEKYWENFFCKLINEQYGGKCYYTKEEWKIINLKSTSTSSSSPRGSSS